MSKILCIVGPTASGKTKLSIALAHLTGGEIVSADSMQIYKYMDIGTAKPSAAEREGIPHHMMDFLEPAIDYSAADYFTDAVACIDDILSRGKLPIVVGGTGLYFDTLTGSVSFDEDGGGNEEVRAKLWAEYERDGADALHARLAAIDPESAASIHKNNVKRVIRAIEVFEITGHTMSQRIREAKCRPARFDSLTIGLTTSDRNILYGRIDHRVDLMMEAGLEQEARNLYAMPLGQTAKQAIGYKELFAWFEGRLTREEAIALVKQESRRYAKRQLTWFKRNKQIEWLEFDKSVNFQNVLENSAALLRKYGIMDLKEQTAE